MSSALPLQSCGSRMPLRVLIVDPRDSTLTRLRIAIKTLARTDACATFSAARERLAQQPYDRLVTNLRLRNYNGLHLVYLAPRETRSIVYTDRWELFLSDEARGAGAFYEWLERLPNVLSGYMLRGLPMFDRRDHACLDRRGVYRGGRRASDRVFQMAP
jgi:hypothetical protein